MNDLKNKTSDQTTTRIKNYEKFYRFYLLEHANPTCRRLHFIGTTFALVGAGYALKEGKISYALMGAGVAYACAWVGHFVFEHNRPATFKQPFYSFISDFRMYSDIIRGRISLKGSAFDKTY